MSARCKIVWDNFVFEFDFLNFCIILRLAIRDIFENMGI